MEMKKMPKLLLKFVIYFFAESQQFHLYKGSEHIFSYEVLGFGERL